MHSPAKNLGSEIGGTKLQIVVGDDAANILEQRRFTVNPAAGGASSLVW